MKLLLFFFFKSVKFIMKPNTRKNVKQIIKKYAMDMDITKNVTVNQFTIVMKFPKRYNLKKLYFKKIFRRKNPLILMA